jgi:hypothetical protein
MSVVLSPLLPMCKYSLLIVSKQAYLLFLISVVQAFKAVFLYFSRGVALIGMGLRPVKN